MKKLNYRKYNKSFIILPNKTLIIFNFYKKLNIFIQLWARNFG